MGRFAQHDSGFGRRRRRRDDKSTALDFDEPRRRRRRQRDEDDWADEDEDWWLDLDEDEWIRRDDHDDFGRGLGCCRDSCSTALPLPTETPLRRAFVGRIQKGRSRNKASPLKRAVLWVVLLVCCAVVWVVLIRWLWGMMVMRRSPSGAGVEV